MKNLIEKFAMWLLSLVGTQIFIVPTSMNSYYGSIMELCRLEQDQDYHTSDLFGSGYFKTRRVLVQMLKEYPELREKKRDLIKAVIVCSDLIHFGQKQTTKKLHQ